MTALGIAGVVVGGILAFNVLLVLVLVMYAMWRDRRPAPALTFEREMVPTIPVTRQRYRKTRIYKVPPATRSTSGRPTHREEVDERKSL